MPVLAGQAHAPATSTKPLLQRVHAPPLPVVVVPVVAAAEEASSTTVAAAAGHAAQPGIWGHVLWLDGFVVVGGSSAFGCCCFRVFFCVGGVGESEMSWGQSIVCGKMRARARRAR